jgi:hypothetical protein
MNVRYSRNDYGGFTAECMKRSLLRRGRLLNEQYGGPGHTTSGTLLLDQYECENGHRDAANWRWCFKCATIY